MKINILSECIYTAISIKHLTSSLQRATNTPACVADDSICFIDVTIANFEALYRAQYANPQIYKIVIITDCPHRTVIVDRKTIILSNLITLDRFSRLMYDLYQRYSHYTEPPKLSQRESLFLAEWSTGKSLSDISNVMKIRNKTATHYKSKIMKKFGTSRIKPLLHIIRVRHLTNKLNIRINKD